jgi:hypothetical protein
VSSDQEARIRERAYAIWLAEGQPEGRHEEHWHRAAQEIAQEDGAPATRRRSPRPAGSRRTRKETAA